MSAPAGNCPRPTRARDRRALARGRREGIRAAATARTAANGSARRSGRRLRQRVDKGNAIAERGQQTFELGAHRGIATKPKTESPAGGVTCSWSALSSGIIAGAAGTVIQKLAPMPGSLSTPMVPPMDSTRRLATKPDAGASAAIRMS